MAYEIICFLTGVFCGVLISAVGTLLIVNYGMREAEKDKRWDE